MQYTRHERPGTARLFRKGLVAIALLAACEVDRYPIGTGLPEAPPAAGGSVQAPIEPSPSATPPAAPAAASPVAVSGCRLAGAPMPTRPVTISPFQVADRLSRFIWSIPADVTFLQAVTQMSLATTSDVAALARGMVDDARASGGVQAFYEKWLELEPSRGRVPTVSPELAVSLKSETYELASYLTRFGGSFADLLQVPFSFLNASVGEHYGVTVQGGEFRRVDLDPAQRGGVLTHASWLLNHYTASKRGMWVNGALYCQPLPPPPLDQDSAPASDPSGTLTSRERVEGATGQANCQICHKLIDPPGFLYEHYDRIGRYRALDNGRPVHTRADVQLPDFEGPLENAAALVKIASGSCEAQACFAQHWLAAATRIEEPDAAAVEEVAAAFRDSRLGLRDLIVAVVQSRLFLQP